MEMRFFVLHSLAYCGLITLALLVIAFKGPRLMLQDYPKSIQNATTPQTRTERKLGIIFGIPFLAVFIGYPLWIGFKVAATNSAIGFVFKHIYAIAMVGNAYDLVIIDWLIICFITPSFVVIPGTEGNKGYQDYKFHFIAFLKGIAITFILACILTCVVKIIV